MSMSPYGFFEECKKKYGDVFTIHLPGQASQVIVADPEGVKTLNTAGYAEVTRFAEGVRFLLGDHAVIFQQDAEHKETRKLMLPPFHGERMRAYGNDMAKIADEVFARFGDGETRLLHKELQEITMRVILRCVFGISEESRLTRLAELITGQLEAMMKPWTYGATLMIGAPRVRDFLRARSPRAKAIDRMLFEEIARKKEEKGGSDILAMLVEARYEDGTALADDVLRDHLMTLLIGGHETTATALSWAVDCALRHPGTLEKMRAEAEHFDPARVKDLNYIGAVVNESMRLNPIATAVSRTLKQDTQLGKYLVPKGTIVSPAIYLMQRDERIWPRPNDFVPERFLDGKAPVYHFFPFGAGVWRCLGAQFAEYEMRVVLARLVTQIDLRAAGESGAPMQRGFTVAPKNGLPVWVSRKNRDALPLSA
jgi:cytochrome P450